MVERGGEVVSPIGGEGAKIWRAEFGGAMPAISQQ